MKRIRSHVQIMLIFTLVVAFCTMTFFTTAAEARRADEVFDSATVSLKTTKKSGIRCNNIWHQKKYINYKLLVGKKERVEMDKAMCLRNALCWKEHFWICS